LALKTRTLVAMLSLAAAATLSSLGITAAPAAAPETMPLPVTQYSPEYALDGILAAGSLADLIDQTLNKGVTSSSPAAISESPSPGFPYDGARKFVSLTADGLTRYFFTTATTVGLVLSERGVQLAATDRINVDLDASLLDDMAIVVQRVTTTTEQRTEAIDWSSSRHYTTDVAPGQRRVAVAGAEGAVSIVTYTVWVDGQVESQQETREVLADPVNEVIEVGVGSGGQPQIIAFNQLKDYGWGDEQFTCIVDLWQRESNWSATAENPYSGAYGIPQALPGSKMASFGDDWTWNPATQIAWGLDYIANRYGSPCGAWSFWVNNNWY
jgi:hypothetical protein